MTRAAVSVAAGPRQRKPAQATPRPRGHTKCGELRGIAQDQRDHADLRGSILNVGTRISADPIGKQHVEIGSGLSRVGREC